MGNVIDTRIGRVIRRKRTVTEFLCSVCRTSFNTLSGAEHCAAMPYENLRFTKGDKVTWHEPAVCTDRPATHYNQRKSFRIKAKVVAIRPLAPMDEEYTRKWLGGKALRMHVYQYEVAFPCHCGKPRTMLLYSAEMRRR